MTFRIEKRDSTTRARLAHLKTHHGMIETPTFMPVGTRGSVKALLPRDLLDIDAKIILGNTYHLLLRPGASIIEKAGGLHSFMRWDRPILTDSGGFQLFSLAALGDCGDEGVHFRSHIDGKKFFLGPIESMEMQRSLGSDIAMCFDHCPKLPATQAELELSLERTHRWAQICADFDRPKEQLLFGIVQGGIDRSLREQSAKVIRSIGFDGYAIGGLSVGESREAMEETVAWTTPFLPEEKPRYLMGVGTPRNLIEAVSAGIDLFDCVMPTRNARNATLFSWEGKFNIRGARFKEDSTPLGINRSPVREFTHSYLRHLFNVGEITALTIATIHNLAFYLDLMAEIRASIREDRFEALYQRVLTLYPQ